MPRWRRALPDVDLFGARLTEGDMVPCAIVAANRDPARFPDPDAPGVADPTWRDSIMFRGPNELFITR